MSHEIYYTSAPEGLKRGTSGFSTVAASENIPKALWDRLESLSAYRHHFGVNAEGGGAAGGGQGGGGQNPVSLAHWILSVTGKTYHVLSRVCDSGVDHTHRTNAFAHHLVLDPAEIEAAPAGPAWLLNQAGVMAEQWDGRVGSIARSHLPGGNDGARVCRSWGNVTGDPGWGGLLADWFVKAPARPVCILFAPGQELLPLLAESIALLPAAARWNVTFNTYFTSMPTSATCLWRCCLAGTPAAQVGLRYAANGLVLDLTDRSRLGELAAGPLVTAARTGQAAKAVAARAAPASPSGPASRPARGAPVRPNKKVSEAAPLELDDGEEEEIERRRAAVFEFTPADEGEITGASGGDSYELADLAREESATPAPPVPTRRAAIPARTIRNADDALQESEREADRAAARRRQQVMYLFVGALGAMALGTALIFIHGRNTTPAEPPPPAPPSPRVVQTPVRTPVAVDPVQTPVVNVPPPVDNVAPPVVNQTQQVTVPPPPPPPARVYPATMVLTTAIERPSVAGIGDRTQSLPLAGADVDRPATISGLQLHFPVPAPPVAKGTGAGGDNAPVANDGQYVSAVLGTYVAKSETRATRPGVAVTWKAAGAVSGQPIEIAFIAFDRNRPGIELQWHSAALLRNPDLFPSLFWLLENSSMELLANPPHEKTQRVAFKPVEVAPVLLSDGDVTIGWPVELPRETAVVAPRLLSLPAGWEVNWFPEWETKDPALRTQANASQMLKFKKGTSSKAIDAWFTITFRPGLAKVENTFAKRQAADEADLARAEADLHTVDGQIEQAKKDAAPETIDKYQSGRDLLEKQNQLQTLVAAFKSATDAYREIQTLAISFDQPDGTRLATVEFKQAAAK